MSWVTTVGVNGGQRRARTWVMMWVMMWVTGTMAATMPATTPAKGMAEMLAGRGGGGLLVEDVAAAAAAAAATAEATATAVAVAAYCRGHSLFVAKGRHCFMHSAHARDNVTIRVNAYTGPRLQSCGLITGS